MGQTESEKWAAFEARVAAYKDADKAEDADEERRFQQVDRLRDQALVVLESVLVGGLLNARPDEDAVVRAAVFVVEKTMRRPRRLPEYPPRPGD